MPIDGPVRVIPDGFAEVTHFLKLSSDPEEMSFSFGIVPAATDVAGLGAALEQVDQAFDDNVQPGLSSVYTWTRTTVRGSIGDGPLVVESNPAIAGGGGAGVVAQNTAVLVEKLSGLAGRANRGRMFIPGFIAVTEVDPNGAIDTAELATRQGIVNDWLAQIVAGAAVEGVVMFHSDFIRNPAVDKDDVTNPAYRIANPNADTPTGVIQFRVDPVVATQRRRLR